MFHRLATIAALAATLAAGLALSSPAAAGNIAWSVSVGGPGFAITAGEPGYAYGGYAYGYGPGARHPYRPYYAAPVLPVVYRAPVVYPAPVVYRRRSSIARRLRPGGSSSQRPICLRGASSFRTPATNPQRMSGAYRPR